MDINQSMSHEQRLRLRKQQIKMTQIQQKLKQVKGEPIQKTKVVYENLLNKLKKQCSVIVDLNDELLSYEEKYEDDYFTQNKFQIIEGEYESALGELKTKISEASNNTKPNILLPKIKISLFTSNYEKWNTFNGIFN